MLLKIVYLLLSIFSLNEFDTMRIANFILNENYIYTFSNDTHTFMSEGYKLPSKNYLEYIEIPNNYQELRIIALNKKKLNYEKINYKILNCSEEVCKIEILDVGLTAGKNIIIDIYLKNNIKPFSIKTINIFKDDKNININKENKFKYYVNKTKVVKNSKNDLIEELKNLKINEYDLIRFQKYLFEIEDYPIPVNDFSFLLSLNLDSAYHAVIGDKDYIFFKSKLISDIQFSQKQIYFNHLKLDKNKSYIDESGSHHYIPFFDKKFANVNIINSYQEISNLGNFKKIFNNYKTQINKFGKVENMTFDSRKKINIAFFIIAFLLVFLTSINKFKISFPKLIIVFIFLIILDSFYFNYLSIIFILILILFNKDKIIKYV